MLSTFLTILPVFLILAAGYLAGRTGVVPADSAQIVNRFVIWIPLPALMFRVVATTDWPAIWDSHYIWTLVVSALMMFGIGMATGRLTGRPMVDMAIDGLNASYANAGYLGLPILLLALGPASVPYAVAAFSLPLSMLFALSIITIELARGHGHGVGRAVVNALSALVRNPVVVSPVLGLMWWLTGRSLPDFALEALHLLGDAAPPVALAGVGLLLAQQPVWHSITRPAVLALTTAKLIVHPLIAAGLAWYLFPMPPMLTLIAILMTAMPTGTGPFMMSGIYARPGGITAGVILLGTVCSILTLSLILTLFPQ